MSCWREAWRQRGEKGHCEQNNALRDEQEEELQLLNVLPRPRTALGRQITIDHIACIAYNVLRNDGGET